MSKIKRMRGYSTRDRFVYYSGMEEINNRDTCWIWKGGKDKDGYGVIMTGSLEGKIKRIRSHRYSWEYFFGTIPNGMLVCHKCDNPACVNPDHLFLGTFKDNTQDMIQKGRKGYNNLGGCRNPRGKLSSQQVVSIRELFSTGRYTKRQLGRMFNIGDRQIGYIVRFESWKENL